MTMFITIPMTQEDLATFEDAARRHNSGVIDEIRGRLRRLAREIDGRHRDHTAEREARREEVRRFGPAHGWDDVHG